MTALELASALLWAHASDLTGSLWLQLLTLAQLQFELGQPEGPETLHHAKTMLELVFGMDHPIRAQINLGMPPL